MAVKTPNATQATEATQATPDMATLLAMFQQFQATQATQQPAQVAPVLSTSQQIATVSPVQVAPVPVGYIPTMQDFIQAEAEKARVKAEKEHAKAVRLQTAPLPKTLTSAELNVTWELQAGQSGTLWYQATQPIIIGQHVISKARLYVDGTKDVNAKNEAKVQRASFVAWQKANGKR